ncbi:EAL domain-containing protein [Lacticaseibacillus absianus]|uniref:EAL domain-containing protein n=1 Tax=Lacticaseibacillus absianus TaxID=2729623 RepID=UPI0015C8B571|nr:EAL domain-containing protein [Lacticaseibacillus absianus]
MLRYFGQPKFLNVASPELIGYELLLREYRQTRWQLPADFTGLSSATLARLLDQTLAALPAGVALVSVNLSQRQFTDRIFLRALTLVRTRCSVELYVELTERDEQVAPSTLVQAAAAFAAAGVAVVVDDVGCGANQLALVTALDPSVSEYKFALQNVRDVMAPPAIAPLLASWRQRATAAGKLFAVEGVESAADLTFVQRFAPDVLQGYYFGRPRLMAIAP